jgi:hypothetical protein
VARFWERLRENAPGDYFVDASCIDCETCRILAPEVFARSDRLGSTALLYRERFLFTGDHLWGTGDGRGLGAYASRALA